MKVIIAGGRNYRLTKDDLDIIGSNIAIEEIVSGGCSGADKDGELYAARCGIPVKVFPAKWETQGKFAGPYRNNLMAEYADAVILFPGGKGTENMRRLAKFHGLKILYDAKNKT
jgi:hypothetical protein